LSKKINKKIKTKKIKTKKIILEFFKKKKNALISYDEIVRHVRNKFPVNKSVIEQQLANLVLLGNIIKTPSKKYIDPKANFLKGTIKFTRKEISIIYEDTNFPIKNSREISNLYYDGDEVLFLQNRGIIQIITVSKRAHKTVIGTIEDMKNFAFLALDNKIGRDLIIEFEHLNMAKDGDKVVAEIFYWPKRSRERVKAKVIKILGKSGNIKVEKESIINDKHVEKVFSDNLINHTNSIDDSISFENRIDLSSQRCFTIDPDTAKDFDDSVFVEKVKSGFNLFVHIADVSHYIKKNSIIDEEAQKRGNSIYTPGEVIPMLPERLSNDLCSLKPNELRYAFTVKIELDEKAIVKKWKFFHSVIESKKRLTYSEAEKISNNEMNSNFSKEILTLKKFAELVVKNNLERGYINFNLPESNIKLKENGDLDSISLKSEIFANKMVEVCMLLANECAAKEIQNSDKESIFRVHDKPDIEKINKLRETLLLYGINLNFSDKIGSKLINDVLSEYENSNNEFLVNEQLLRSMQKAIYSPDNIGHFGLALEDYTHFTSPIRRYADLIVHRTLNSIIEKRDFEYSYKDLSKISKHISETEKIATTIERKVAKLYFVEYMKDKIGENFNAKISGIISNGVFVQLENSPIEGMIPIKFLGNKLNDTFSFDADKNCFSSKYNGELFLGVKVKISLKKVNTKKTMIDFELIEIYS